MNEKDLLNFAMMIAASEESARLVAEALVEKVRVEVAPTPSYRTVIGKEADFTIPAAIIDEKGSGQLKELLIKSDFKEWRLIVFVDSQQLYDNSYDWFMKISQELEEVDAFQTEDGTYILRLSDIKFAESIKVKAEPLIQTLTEKLKLKEIFWRLELAKLKSF